MAFLIILGVFLWIMVGLWPAFIAKNKGYSFILFWLLAWFISFLLALIIALVLPDKLQRASTGSTNETAAEAD